MAHRLHTTPVWAHKGFPGYIWYKQDVVEFPMENKTRLLKGLKSRGDLC